jgi:hypothetical protein
MGRRELLGQEAQEPQKTAEIPRVQGKTQREQFGRKAQEQREAGEILESKPSLGLRMA